MVVEDVRSRNLPLLEQISRRAVGAVRAIEASRVPRYANGHATEGIPVGVARLASSAMNSGCRSLVSAPVS